jgi:DNA-binding response OmpR family regulator
MILIVDDEPYIRESLRRFLTRAGYQVAEARNVDEALATLGAGGISAVILDMLLPNSGGRSGLDVLASIRSNPPVADVPVLILTGHALSRAVQDRAAALGAELLRKPIEYQQLAEKLDQLRRRPKRKPDVNHAE